MTKIIAVANQKGGVGKTTTAVNLSAGLAVRGYKTLLIDLDQQRNATHSFELPEIETTLADILVGSKKELRDIREAIYETHLVGLDLVPANIRLALVEKQSSVGEQFRLKDSLSKLTEYDFILIDCPPSLGATLTQALLASDFVLVPIAAPIDLKKLCLKFKREIFSESEPILIQAFYARESADAVPIDQILLRPQQKISPLALPKGKFRIIALDKTGKILSRYEKNIS